jgi:anti-sigma factor ChrR (cupin superfamily)
MPPASPSPERPDAAHGQDRGVVPMSQLVETAAVEWVERRPGVFWRTLWESADGRQKAALVRYAPGATIPRHRHLGDEQIYVLEGSVRDDAGTCTAGNYARRPPGCVHTVVSDTGALVFAVISGPTEPV